MTNSNLEAKRQLFLQHAQQCRAEASRQAELALKYEGAAEGIALILQEAQNEQSDSVQAESQGETEPAQAARSRSKK